MKKNLLMAIPYNCAIEVTNQLYLDLIECDIYKIEGWGDNRKFLLSDEDWEIYRTHLTKTVEQINMEDMLAENNRLSRENELLTTKLKQLEQSNSTELVVK